MVSPHRGSIFIGVLATDRQLPIGYSLIAVKLNPGLHQPQLLAGQLTREDLAITNANGRLTLGVLRVDVRPVAMFIVEEIQTNDDPVKHGNNWHE
jgi:hypothetical protein